MKKILYVEDNEDTAEAVKIVLETAGFVVDTVECGKKALAKTKEHFNLYLLDIMLPDMSGWDIYQKLTKQKVKSKYAFISAIPVSSERMKELAKAGVSDYITKPFENEDLVKRIKIILE